MAAAWKLASLGLLVCLCWFLYPLPAGAQSPDFSDTPDILNGTRSMLRTDDLALTTSLLPSASPYNAATYTSWLLTADSSIANMEQVTVTSVLTGPVTAAADIVIGRMFDLPNDVAAVVAVDAGPPAGQGPVLAVTIYDRLGNRSFRQPLPHAGSLGDPGAVIETLMADFTGDGYDDLAIAYGVSLSRIVIVTAVNPANWDAGLHVGEPFLWGQPLASLAAADVGGDGVPQLIAVANGSPPDGFGGGILILNIQPQTLYPMLQSSTPPASGGLLNVLVVGDFDDNPADDEVVLVSGQVGGTQTVAVQLYDFASSPPVPVLLDQLPLEVPILTAIAADGAAVHPLGSDGDAIVFAVQSIDGSGYVTFLTVEGNTFVSQPYVSRTDFTLYDLALGRFDHRTPAGSIDPNLQLALFGQVAGQPGPTLSLYDIGSACRPCTSIGSCPHATIRSTQTTAPPPTS
jgi:hypothetical protein